MSREKDPSASIAKTGHALDAQRFQMLKDIAEELTGEIVFPIHFDLALRMRKGLQAEDSNADELCALIRLDPLISARLIGLANSVPYNDGSQPVRGLRDAIERLGVEETRKTALAICAHQFLLCKDMVDFDTYANRLWAHSLYCASAAYVISKRLTHVDPEDAQLAGLIHDLGAFYMLYRATQYEELRIRPDTVKHLIGTWHESIGHALLLSLGVPELVADAIRDHDQPRAVPNPPRNMSDVVYVSNLLACQKHAWKTEADAMPRIDHEIYRNLIGEIDDHERGLRAPEQ